MVLSQRNQPFIPIVKSDKILIKSNLPNQPVIPTVESNKVVVFTANLPTEIAEAQTEGVLSGDVEAETRSVAMHSGQHRDTPNLGTDVLPSEKYTGDLQENEINKPDTFIDIVKGPPLNLITAEEIKRKQEEALTEASLHKAQEYTDVKKREENYIKYNEERLQLITELTNYASTKSNPTVANTTKNNFLLDRLNTYFRQHSDVGVGALKKRNAYKSSLENETLFTFNKLYKIDQEAKAEKQQEEADKYNKKEEKRKERKPNIHTFETSQSERRMKPITPRKETPDEERIFTRTISGPGVELLKPSNTTR